jgi:hypothetical protein
MSRQCTICQHSELQAITADLMARVPYRTIERRYTVSRSAIDRHVTQHVSKAFRQLAAAEKLTDAATVAEPVLSEMRKLNARALRILADAELAEDRTTALHAIRECRRNLELIAKLTGELDPRAVAETSGGPLTVVVQYVDKQALLVHGDTPALPGSPEAPRLNGGFLPSGHSTEMPGNILEPGQEAS